MRAYIGLGSNLGGPEQQLRKALQNIEQIERSRITAISRFYRSAPMGPANQPDYCNAACTLETELPARQLLEALIEIERALGRERGVERWGPRLLDLDLLHVEGLELDEPGLKLPHPGLMQRNFVLVPLAEIAPTLEIAHAGSVAQAAYRIGHEGLEPWHREEFLQE